MIHTSNSEPLVVFTPSGKRGHFPIGTPVLTAARSLGVDIDSVCGGRAFCGRCQVHVAEGEFAKHGIKSDANNLSAAADAEHNFRQRRGLKSDRRLSCQATVQANVVIDVPESSQVHRQVVRKPHEAHDIDIDPIVHAYFVEVAEPDMHIPGGDLQRLLAALQSDWDLTGLSCELHVKQQLQSLLRQGDWKVTVAVRNDDRIVAVWSGFKDQLYGAAIDVGSTTIAAHLCNLASGDVVASAGSMNPQIRFGEDLMSRISYIMMNDGGEKDLIAAVRNAINELLTEVCDEAGIETSDVIELTVVGNPIMQHLVLGIDPVQLGTAPFALATDASVDARASEFGININRGGHLYSLPCIAGHVGADCAAVLLAESPDNNSAVSLVVDVGTNAEMLLGNNERVLAASSPTGPAFEGAQISSGQRAAPGAIERVRIDRETLEPRFRVIGSELWSDDPGFSEEVAANGITGICGSGIIEVVAEMYLAGVIDSDGVIREADKGQAGRVVKDGRTWSYILSHSSPEIRVSQNDVRAIQLAKAALYAGARLLMERFGAEKVDRIRLAGAFGAHIDVKYAMVLGLIPDCDLGQVSSAGNAAGTGARIALLDRSSRGRIEDKVRQVEKIETAVATGFQDHFVAAMAIPHASDGFSELSRVVDLPARSQSGATRDRKRRRRRSPGN